MTYKRSLLFACGVAMAVATGIALAQVISTPRNSALYTGAGTGVNIGKFDPPDSQAKCNAAAASQPPGNLMCKTIFVNACAPAAASSVTMKSCALPLVGQWQQTTTWTVNAKTCLQTSAVSPASAPTGACTTAPPVVTSWAFLANEGAAFTVTGTRQVRIGVESFPAGNGTWSAPVSVTTSGTCSMSFLKVADPKPFSAKVCQVSGVAEAPPKPPTPPEPPASGPVTMPGNAFFKIDLTKTPVLAQSPRGGWDKPMIIPATSAPTPSDVGAFRTGCQAVAVLPDDPIVYPGQPGMSHPHVFFGAVGVNANTTTESLRATTHATCRGGPPTNNSSYWTPALIDIRTGAPIAPLLESNFYYKRHTAMPTSLKIAPIPQGFRMIAGDSKGTPDKPSNAALYACIWDGGASAWFNHIPAPSDCRVNGFSWLIVGVDFPSCWTGEHLDSPDHKSHVASPINPGANGAGYCPSTHPVAIPFVAFQILYQIKDANDLKYWRLASDNYDVSKPAGYSGHGDVFSMWQTDIEDTWLKGCVNALKDCSSHLLGDGRQLVIP